jgi:hypothetical protein
LVFLVGGLAPPPPELWEKAAPPDAVVGLVAAGFTERRTGWELAGLEVAVGRVETRCGAFFWSVTKVFPQ